MKTVGPATSRKSSNNAASPMFVLLSHWMPLCTPETAESTNAAVRTAMIATAIPFEIETSQRMFMPPLIWSAPSPSDVALPNSVAKIARPSIARPIGPSTRSPSSGRNAVLIRLRCPLRNTKYASARPTIA
jgi:hypothetical protein